MVLVIERDYLYAELAVAFLSCKTIHCNCQVFRTLLI